MKIGFQIQRYGLTFILSLISVVIFGCNPPDETGSSSGTLESCNGICVYAPPQDFRAARAVHIPVRSREYHPQHEGIVINWDIVDTIAELNVPHQVFFKWNLPLTIYSSMFANQNLGIEPTHLQIVREDPETGATIDIFYHPAVVNVQLSKYYWDGRVNCGPFCRYYYDNLAFDSKGYIYKARAVRLDSFFVNGKEVGSSHLRGNDFTVDILWNGKKEKIQFASPFQVVEILPKDQGRMVSPSFWFNESYVSTAPDTRFQQKSKDMILDRDPLQDEIEELASLHESVVGQVPSEDSLDEDVARHNEFWSAVGTDYLDALMSEPLERLKSSLSSEVLDPPNFDHPRVQLDQ